MNVRQEVVINEDNIDLSTHLSINSFIEIKFNIICDTNQDLDQKDLIGCQTDCNCVEDIVDNRWTQELNQLSNGLCECSHNRCEVVFNYHKNGLLVNWDKPIYECGTNCFCNTCPILKSKCNNRWTQRPTDCVKQLFFDPSKGQCLRTLTDLRFGQFVTEYCGEVIDKIEAKKRFNCFSESKSKHNYILIFREYFGIESTFETIIDAKSYGNESRFVNHSCDPNLIALPVRSDSLRPRICLFAAKDIVSGSELSYNYGSNDSLLSNKTCFCGSDVCRGFMPLDTDL